MRKAIPKRDATIGELSKSTQGIILIFNHNEST